MSTSKSENASIVRTLFDLFFFSHVPFRSHFCARVFIAVNSCMNFLIATLYLCKSLSDLFCPLGYLFVCPCCGLPVCLCGGLPVCPLCCLSVLSPSASLFSLLPNSFCTFFRFISACHLLNSSHYRIHRIM